MEHLCEKCGNSFSRKGSAKYRFCSRVCYFAGRGRSHNWKGGTFRPDGYKLVYTPDGRRVREHRYVVEKALGRPLEDKEIVHHIDGNPANNAPENLFVTTTTNHRRHHATFRSRTKKQCSACGKIKRRTEFSPQPPKKPTHDPHDSRCKDCNASFARRKRLLNQGIKV